MVCVYIARGQNLYPKDRSEGQFRGTQRQRDNGQKNMPEKMKNMQKNPYIMFFRYLWALWALN